MFMDPKIVMAGKSYGLQTTKTAYYVYNRVVDT